jgi:predicted dehydrogenase
MPNDSNAENKRTSRRRFLKSTTSAALGSGVLANLAISKGAFAAGDDTIRVGLIGCGGRGGGAALQALSTAGNVQLVAMADAFEDRLEGCLTKLERKLADRSERISLDDDHKFSGFDAYQQVIDADVDLVILATPPGFRPIHFEAAVNAGKHVFMEKPVATDAPGVRSVLASNKVAQQKNLKVGVGLQRHHQALYLETIGRIKEGGIGDVLALRVYWNSYGVWEPRRERSECRTEMEYQMRNWYYYNWLSGDHIVEQHIHNLDVANWVKGGVPIRAHGMGGRQVRTDKQYGDIFDHHAVEFEYEDGSRAFSQCRHIPNTWTSVTEHAIGSKGTANISAGIIESGAWNSKYEKPKPNPDPYQVEHDHLFTAIRNDTPYNEAENGALATMTAILGRMASYGGKPVEWDQAFSSEQSLMPERFDWDAMPVTVPDEEGVYRVPTPGITQAL